ncbi:Sugar/inositol transporter [Corchorus olitorius]|uniref:Sugar/inositol transporter n=1 Tax=Corchorus olitorius TaxID=93759 RepID=A0A1R3KHN4_9ROSI|nr:Sugar/inositol transporter [Corchorus olitorius]
MAISPDVENGESSAKAEMKEPLLHHTNNNDDDCKGSNREGSLKVVFISTFIAVLGAYAFGSCMGYSAPVQTAITKDLDLSVAEAMRVSSAFTITGWLAIYFAKVPIYVAEIAPKELRGGLATLNQLMICIGGSVSFVAGTFLPWRLLALTAITPCLVQLVGLPFIPESPRWLAKNGYQKEFYNALRKLHGDDADISHEAAEIQDYLQTLEKQPKATMLDLFQKRYIHSVTIGVGLMAFQQFGGVNGIGFYTRETLTFAGFSSGTNTAIIIFALIQIPITAGGAFLVDNCGRRPLLLVSSTGTFLGCFLAAISFLMKEHNLLQEWVPLLVLSALLIFMGSFAIGMGAVPWVLMSEIFPINVKGAAGSMVNLIHWFGSWAVSYSFNFLMDWSPPGTFFLYSGVCAASVLFVAKIVPETKGRTLEQIQASINS